MMFCANIPRSMKFLLPRPLIMLSPYYVIAIMLLIQKILRLLRAQSRTNPYKIAQYDIFMHCIVYLSSYHAGMI